MFRLTDSRDQERGAVAVIVAVFVGVFVLTGVAALAIDAGQIYAERRVLQNGADAAALALAQICAEDSMDPNSTDPRCGEGLGDVNGDGVDELGVTNGLRDLAGANAADDQLSSIDSICGFGPDLVPPTGTAFETCPTVTALTSCPDLSATLLGANVNYVEVRTRTLTNSGSVVRRLFAGFGNDTYQEKTVQACARAGYGPLGNFGDAFPLVLGVCAWNKATNFGTIYATPPDPQYTPAPNRTGTGPGTSPLPPIVPDEFPLMQPKDFLTAITAHTSSGVNGAFKCGDPLQPVGPAGKYYPGGFGWVKTCEELGTCEPDQKPCSADFPDDTGTVAQGKNGASAPDGCRQGGLKPYVGTVVYIPVFDKVLDKSFHIAGFAAFYLAGYSNVPAGGPKDMDGYNKSLAPGCDPEKVDSNNNSSTCIWGWFTAGKLVPYGSISTSNSTERGPLAVQLLG